MATNTTQSNISINVATNAGAAAGQVNALVTSTTSLTTATTSQTAAQQTLTQQLQQATAALQALQNSGTATATQIQQATQNVQSLNSQLAATSAAIPGANAGPTFNRFAAGANLAAQSTAAVVSGLALVGVEGEAVGETLLKVQAATAFAQSIASITEMADQISDLKDTVLGVYRSFVAARQAVNAATAANTALTSANTAATITGTVATGGASGAMAILNAVMAANPIGAIITAFVAFVAVVAGLVLGVRELTKWLINSGDAGDALRDSTKAATKAIEEQNRAISKGREDREDRLKYELDLAAAQGKSSAELRKITTAQQESIVQEEYANALKARSILMAAQKAKADAVAAGVTGDSIKKMDEVIKTSYESFKAINENYNAELRKRRQLANDNAVAVVQEQTDHEKEMAQKAKEAWERERDARKERRDREREERKAFREELLNEIHEFNLLKIQIENDDWDRNREAQREKDELLKSYRSETELQKLEEQYNNDKRVLENANASQEERFELEAYYISEKDRIQEESDQKRLEDAQAAKDKQLEIDQALRDAKLEIQNSINDNAMAAVNLGKIVFEKNKAIQKGLLIAENAAGIAKIVVNTAAANAKAVAASPITGGQPFVAINTISGALGIATSIAATVKGLKELGGGGDAGSSPQINGGGGGGGNSDPQVNFQASQTSQLQSTIQNAQADQGPVRAFVVSSEMTSQQQLDRNLVDSNTF